MEQMYVCLSVRLFVHCLLCIVYVAWVLEGWNLNFVGVFQATLLLYLLYWQVNFLNTSIKGPNNTRELTNCHLILYLL